VSNTFWRSLSIAATVAIVGAFAFDASAQDKKAPAKQPPACNSLKDESACKARNDCNWVSESKDAKGKVKRKAYCRSNPTPKKK
jgi:anti-sigma-K factor RskA